MLLYVFNDLLVNYTSNRHTAERKDEALFVFFTSGFT